jgi:hypothetical protein
MASVAKRTVLKRKHKLLKSGKKRKKKLAKKGTSKSKKILFGD